MKFGHRQICPLKSFSLINFDYFRSAEDLIKAFRQKMLSRGARSIIGIGRVFKIMDDNRSGTLDL